MNEIHDGMFFGPVIQGRKVELRLPYEITPALSGLDRRDEFFAGRSEELRELAAELRQFPVVTIAGIAGVGKTQLAVQAAWRVWKDEGYFRGGVLFIDLHGYSELRLSPSAALAQLLRAFAVPPEHIPSDEQELLRLYRSVLEKYAGHDLRLLVLLDNAAGEQHVRSLLPPEGFHAAMVTSRHKLVLGKARHELPQLAPHSAVEVLRLILGRDGRVDAERASAEQIAHLCGYLPLALQISGALLADRTGLSLAQFAEKLADAHRRLDELTREERNVRAAFNLSYQQLPREQARLFRLLALNPGPDVSTESAARLADAAVERLPFENTPGWARPREHDRRPDVPVENAGRLTEGDVERLLASLARAHLIDEARPGRWRFHDLVRLYAEELPVKFPGQEGMPGQLGMWAAYQRLTEHLLVTTFDATQPLNNLIGGLEPEFSRFVFAEQEGLDWLDAEYDNLLAVTLRAQRSGDHETAARLPVFLTGYLRLRRRFPEWLDQLDGAVKAAQALRQPYLTGIALYCRCQALLEMGRLDEAATAARRAAKLFRENDDEFEEAVALDHLGVVLAHQGKLAEAVEIHRRTVAKLTWGMAGAHAQKNLGSALFQLGAYEEAAEASGEAAERFERLLLNDQLARAEALATQGLALNAIGRYPDAWFAFYWAEYIFRERGEFRGQAVVLNGYGLTLRAQGQHEKAVEVLIQAVISVEKTDDRALLAEILRNLGEALDEVGRHEDAVKCLTGAAAAFRAAGNATLARELQQRLQERSGTRKLSLGARLLRLARPKRRWEREAQTTGRAPSLADDD